MALQAEEQARRARIEALKARIASQTALNAKVTSDTDAVMARVRAQKMTKAEYRATIQET